MLGPRCCSPGCFLVCRRCFARVAAALAASLSLHVSLTPFGRAGQRGRASQKRKRIYAKRFKFSLWVLLVQRVFAHCRRFYDIGSHCKENSVQSMSSVLAHLACRASECAPRAHCATVGPATGQTPGPCAPLRASHAARQMPVQRSYRWAVGSASVTFSHYRCDVITFVGIHVIDVVLAVVSMNLTSIRALVGQCNVFLCVKSF